MRCRINSQSEHAVSTLEEFERLVARCRELACEEPFLVECTCETGDTLMVGLGRELGVLQYVQASLEPPYLVSLGNPKLASDEVLTFLLEDQPTEIPARHGIPIDLAIDGLRSFFLTSKLPDALAWEEV